MYDNKYKLGFEIRKLDLAFRHEIDKAMRGRGIEKLTGVQGRILGFLHRKKGEEICQRDIEKEFSIRRSTATAILQTMEKNGLITKRVSDDDARIKYIYPTEISTERFKAFNEEINSLEKRTAMGISDKEMAEFLRIAEKIKRNLGVEND